MHRNKANRSIVMDYDTGERLAGNATADLIAASEWAKPTGAVKALCNDAGEWEHVSPWDVSRMERMGYPCRTVWVEVLS